MWGIGIGYDGGGRRDAQRPDLKGRREEEEKKWDWERGVVGVCILKYGSENFKVWKWV